MEYFRLVEPTLSDSDVLDHLHIDADDQRAGGVFDDIFDAICADTERFKLDGRIEWPEEISVRARLCDAHGDMFDVTAHNRRSKLFEPTKTLREIGLVALSRSGQHAVGRSTYALWEEYYVTRRDEILVGLELSRFDNNPDPKRLLRISDPRLTRARLGSPKLDWAPDAHMRKIMSVVDSRMSEQRVHNHKIVNYQELLRVARLIGISIGDEEEAEQEAE